VIQAPWNPGDPNDIGAFFEWPDTLTPGANYIISMDGDGMSKTYTVADVRVTSMDAGTDQISGVASPNANVRVCVNTPGNCIPRYLTANGSGNWTADYSVVGSQSDETTLDLNPGDNGWAAEDGEFGDQTWLDWNIPNPYIEVAPYSNWIHAREWALGVDVTMEIDDPTTVEAVDYTETQTVIQAPWNPGDPNDIGAFFEWPDALTPGADYIISMDGDGQTKTYAVADVRVTSMDADTDQISGVASPNANVQVCVNMPGYCIPRYLTADGSGNWTADYSIAGGQSDEVIHDLNPGDNGWASENGEFGDQTRYDWNIPNPDIRVAPYSNWIEGREWDLGVDVTMEIDDPADGTGDVDYTEIQTVIQAPWNPGDPTDIAAFFEWPDTLTPGADYIISMDGDGMSKTYIVADLRVTSMDANADQISGVASPNANVQVCVNIPGNCIPRYLIADGSGNWTADYSVAGGQSDEVAHDLNLGDNGWAAENGEFGDQTLYDWNIPNPRITVQPDHGWVGGNDWTVGNTVTIIVDDTPTPSLPYLYTDSQTVQGDSTFWFPVEPTLDLLAGQYITVSDTVTTKSMQIEEIHFDSVNEADDTAAGRGPHDAPASVFIRTTTDEMSLDITIGSTGNWSVDFSPFDIQNVQDANVQTYDNDGDSTLAHLSCYTLTLNHTGNGSDVTASPTRSDGCGAGQYIAGAAITLSGATPDAGWKISGWTGTANDSSIASTNTLVMPAGDHTATIIYVADSIAPTVLSIVAADANPTDAASVDFTITFSETVTGVGAADFSLFTSGVTGASITSLTPVSGTTYTVTVNTGSGNGTIRLDLKASGTGIQDLAQNPISGGFAGEEYTITKIQQIFLPLVLR
jgi:hypothetical protein